jgi:hypothetical protein
LEERKERTKWIKKWKKEMTIGHVNEIDGKGIR